MERTHGLKVRNKRQELLEIALRSQVSAKPAVSINFLSFYLKREAGATPAAARIAIRGRALTGASGAVYDQGKGQDDSTGRPSLRG
jgi:hypothetical protein